MTWTSITGSSATFLPSGLSSAGSALQAFNPLSGQSLIPSSPALAGDYQPLAPMPDAEQEADFQYMIQTEYPFRIDTVSPPLFISSVTDRP